MDEGRAASPPPLLAYTASHQQSARGGNKKRGASATASSSLRARQQKSQQRRSAPQSRRKDAPVVFDEEARREYLTGFHKRKQARIEQGRERARLREKEDRRRMREDARKAKKQQAADNVRAEKQAYGVEDDSEDEDGAGPSGRGPALSPSAYETEEHHTTVTVQAWDPDADEDEMITRASTSRAAPEKSVKKDVLPPSSRRMAKKLKSDEAQRQRERMAQKLGTKPPVDRKGKKRQDASAISNLLDDGMEIGEDLHETAVAEAKRETASQAQDGASKGRSSNSKKPFRYESKLDRAKAKAAQKEANAKFAQKRKEAAILNGGRKTTRGGGKSGKAGRGGSKGKGRGGKR